MEIKRNPWLQVLVKWKSLSCVWLFVTPWTFPWNSPGQNTRVGSLSLLQGIFPTQESNPGLPHCRQILSQLSHKGSPRIQEWVAYPLSSRSSQPRNWTGVSCIAGRFFTSWASSYQWSPSDKRSSRAAPRAYIAINNQWPPLLPPVWQCHSCAAAWPCYFNLHFPNDMWYWVIEHLFICLSVFYIFSLVRYLFRSLAHF